MNWIRYVVCVGVGGWLSLAVAWAGEPPPIPVPPIPVNPIQAEQEDEDIGNVPPGEPPGIPEAIEQQNEEKETDMVIIQTSKGNIKVKLNAELAPITVANFLEYVDAKHYDGTIFHRVIAKFMIQGGGSDASMRQKPTRDPIRNEAANGLSNKRGTIAMARTAIVDSATSQFFINVVDNNFLDFRAPNPQSFGYCVFGEVVEGMDVVDAIRNVQTGVSSGMSDVPKEVVEIISIRRGE